MVTSCWAVHEDFITTLPWKQNWIFWASVHASRDFHCISTISHHCWPTKSVTISAMILCLSVKRQKQGKFLVALPVANCCDIYLLSQTASQPTRDSIYVISTVNSRETQIKKVLLKGGNTKQNSFALLMSIHWHTTNICNIVRFILNDVNKGKFSFGDCSESSLHRTLIMVLLYMILDALQPSASQQADKVGRLANM